jgi:hypothetical protein
MNAGQTNIKVGTRVEICNIEDVDSELNGLRGTVTHPFAFGATGKDWIGIYVDAGTANMPYGGRTNVKINEIKIIDETKKTLDVHPSKVFGYIYPLYAKEFLLGNSYEEFAELVQKDFDLTPDQWEALLNEWEIKENILN